MTMQESKHRMQKEDYGLIPSLRALLERSVQLGTTRTSILADSLSLSEATVDTYWKQIKKVLNTEERHEAVRLTHEGRILSKMPNEG